MAIRAAGRVGKSFGEGRPARDRISTTSFWPRYTQERQYFFPAGADIGKEVLTQFGFCATQNDPVFPAI